MYNYLTEATIQLYMQCDIIIFACLLRSIQIHARAARNTLCANIFAKDSYEFVVTGYLHWLLMRWALFQYGLLAIKGVPSVCRIEA